MGFVSAWPTNHVRITVGETSASSVEPFGRRCAVFTDTATTAEHDKAPSGWAA